MTPQDEDRIWSAIIENLRLVAINANEAADLAEKMAKRYKERNEQATKSKEESL